MARTVVWNLQQNALLDFCHKSRFLCCIEKTTLCGDAYFSDLPVHIFLSEIVIMLLKGCENTYFVGVYLSSISSLAVKSR